jgi:hypothetical protein
MSTYFQIHTHLTPKSCILVQLYLAYFQWIWHTCKYVQIRSTHTCKYIQDTYKYIHIHSNTYTPNAQVMYTIILGIFSVDTMAYMQIRTNTCIYVQIHQHTFRYIHIHSKLNTYNRSMQGYAAAHAHSDRARATGSESCQWPGTARGQGTSIKCTQFQVALLSATVRPGFKLGCTCQWTT